MARPGLLGIVSLAAVTALEDEIDDLNNMAERFCNRVGWWPVATQHIAGALKFTEYDFFKKWIMKRIAESHYHEVETGSDIEFTDWAELDRTIEQFINDVPNFRNKI